MPRSATDPRATRLALIGELLQAARKDDVTDYAAAYGALIEFERELGAVDSDRHVCAVCGCTDEAECPGGCYWVLDNLCSRCLVDLAARHGVRPQRTPGE